MAVDEEGVARIAKRVKPVARAEPFVKVMAYGRNGSGKTRFAASAEDCLIIDINQRGTRSVRRTDAEVVRISKWEDVGNVYWYLRANPKRHKAFALDTITDMQDLCMRYVLKEQADLDAAKDPAIATKRDWGKTSQLMKRWMLQYRNLPMHAIFLAQERQIMDEDTGQITLHTVDLPAGARQTALGCVEVLGRMYSKEVKTKGKATVWEDRMLVGPHEKYDTKDRTYELGRIVRKPTMTKVIEASFSNFNDKEQ